MFTHTRLLGATIGALVAAGAIAACASPADSRTQGGGAQSVSLDAPTIVSWLEVKRPIDAYTPTASQAVAIAHARFDSADACLADRGYPGIRTEPEQFPAFVVASVRDEVVRADLYGFFDTDNVKAFGYTRPPTTPGLVQISQPPGVPEAIAKACSKASVEAVPDINLPAGGPSPATNDPRVVQAREQWADCMATRGVKAGDPVQLEADHQSRSADDLRVAQSDIACKVQTNFIGIAITVQSENDEAYIAKNADALRVVAQELSRYGS